MSEWRVACFLSIHGVVSDVRNIDVTKFTEFSAAVNIHRTDSMSKHRLSPLYVPVVMGHCHRYYRVDIDIAVTGNLALGEQRLKTRLTSKIWYKYSTS